MVPLLVFDIETVPDAHGLRSVWGLEGDDDAVVAAALERRRLQTGGQTDFLPHHLHKVIVISMLFRDDEGLRIRSLTGGPADEGRLIQGFFKTIERYTPTLVSWNGSGFDLPVLHYRGLVHAVQAPRYWDQGEDDRDFKWNNYVSRYHARHTDLMDLLALFNGRSAAPLDQIARLCGAPGKLGMDGSQVYDAWRAGLQDEVRDYCETDVVNTWLVYCRFQLMRGALTREAYDAEMALTRQTLSSLDGAHWLEFLEAWPA